MPRIEAPAVDITLQHLKLRRIGRVAARHSQVAQNELREEGQIESDKDDQRRESSPTLPDTAGR